MSQPESYSRYTSWNYKSLYICTSEEETFGWENVAQGGGGLAAGTEEVRPSDLPSQLAKSL